MKENKIAIVMAAYNAEKTIARALESVLNQTYQSWTVIVVDDGSVDETAEIVKGYMRGDERIQLFSRKNGGAMSAKRQGIELAGECDYLTFLDSDDYYIKHNLLELLNHVIESESTDCVCFNYSINGKRAFSDYNGKKIFYDKKDILKNILCRTIIDGNMQFAIYKYEIVYEFFKVRECENDDFLNKYDLLQHSQKVIYVPIEGYFYYINPESLTHQTVREKDWLYYLHAKEFCLQGLKEYPEAKAECDYFENWVLLWLALRLTDDKSGKQLPMYNKVMRQLKKKRKIFLSNHYFSKKEKITYILVYVGIYRVMHWIWLRFGASKFKIGTKGRIRSI